MRRKGESPLANAPFAPVARARHELGLSLLRTMIRIRVLEEGIEKHFLAGEIPGFAHLSIGQEAVAAGTCANLRTDDAIASTHRGHGHTLAKGTSMRAMVAELFARATGVCRGKGGSMHIADFSVGMLGANGVVAGGFGLVAGAALSAVQRKTDQVAVCFFGDGATNRGPFHENLNLCAIWNLPAIFVLENNRYASTTSTAETMKIPDVARRADGYGIPAAIVDGFDPFAVYDALAEATARARSGGGPTFVECKTYRARGHYIGDPERYRNKTEVEDVMTSSDPIVRLQGTLGDALAPTDFEALWIQAREEFADAVAFARSSPAPERSEAFFGVYAGDRDAHDPVHRIEARERDEMLRFAPDVATGSQGSGH
jgi:acetoin:2,6-dichlorophenolindophenol oxidoreductase subunit alpha